MPRARLLKPDFFDDEKLTLLPFGARILFEALWTLADREGRLRDNPAKIAAYVFPALGNEGLQGKARRDVPAWLELLAEHKMVKRYEVAGEPYMLLRNWGRHQKVHINEPKSALPPPMDDAAPPLETNDLQKSPMSPDSYSDPVSDPGTEAEAEAGAESPRAREGFAFKTDPPFPDEEGFVGEYQRHVAESQGRSLGASEFSDARALERAFGTAACIQAAQDTRWEKGPGWLRKKLESQAQRAPPSAFANGLASDPVFEETEA